MRKTVFLTLAICGTILFTTIFPVGRSLPSRAETSYLSSPNLATSASQGDDLLMLDISGERSLVLIFPSRELVLDIGGNIVSLGVTALAAKFVNSEEILFIDETLSLKRLDPNGISPILPESRANGPLFISKDRRYAAYLKPSDFLGGTIPHTNSVAVMDLANNTEQTLFGIPGITIHLYGWSGDSLVVEVPYWSPITLSPPEELVLGVLPLSDRPTQIGAFASLPRLLANSKYPQTSFDQSAIAYETDSDDVVISSLETPSYAIISDVRDPMWAKDGLTVVRGNMRVPVDLSSLMWTEGNAKSKLVPLPSTPSQAMAYVLPDPTAGLSGIMSILLYRPVSSNIPVSAYYDLDRNVGHWRDWQGNTGTSWVYGQSYDQHEGTDYDGTTGDPIYASQTGTVGTIYIDCTNTWNSGTLSYGTNFRINHGTLSDGNIYATGYAHLKCDAVNVTENETISSLPRQIAQMGNTGYSSGDHLHLNVRKGASASLIDPYEAGIISDSPASGGTCSAPSLIEPGDGATLSSRTITFRWNAVSGCTFNGYTFRVKNTSNMDSGGTTIIDTGEGGTQRTETINGWDNQDLWWGVKAANAPSGANWAVRRFRIEPGGTSCNPNADQVALYANTNYGGSCVTLNIGDYPNPGYLAPVGNDNVESIRVGSNVQAILYEHDNYGGRSETFTGDDSNLGDNSIGANVVSSVKVQSRVTTCNTPSPSSPCNGVRINQTSNVNFSWSGNCSQYYAEYWGGPAGTIGSGWIGSTSWNPGQLWCGNYSWHVKGKSSSGQETGWSSTCNFTVVPNTPSGLTASAASSSQINLSWNDPGGEKDGYNVYRNGSKVGTTAATTYQDTGLSCNTGYSYYVKVYKGSLESDPSNTASATTQPCGPAITVDSVSVDRCAGGAARTFAAEGPSAIVGQEKSEAFVALAAPVFRRGEKICMGIAGTNHTNNSISTYWSWTTRNSKGEKIQALSYDDWPWTMTPGWNGAGWGPTIPSNLPPGLYTFTGYIRWDGGIDSKSTTFTVVVAGGADFDGDGKADAAIYRDAYWYIKTSSTGWSSLTTIWHGGLSGDKPLVGDFDGDGKADAVIYRGAYWYIKTSSTGWSGLTTIWHGGASGDEPLVGDFDGDGKADAVIYRGGYWYIKTSGTGWSGLTTIWHGGLPGDKPLVGDFDGDGKADAVIYRGAYWYIKTSSTGWSGLTTIWHGGASGDKPLVGDFDGDGKADAVIYRGAYWYIKTSSTGWSGLTTIWHGGASGDKPLVGDFDGDGKADAVIYRGAYWYIKTSGTGWSGLTTIWHGGLPQDKPLPDQ